MKKQLIAYASSAVVAVGMVVGCAASSDDGSAPGAAEAELGPQQFVDAGGGWGASASISQTASPTMVFQATFSGPANTQRKMGLCALEWFDRGDGVGTYCTGTPQALPDGGTETVQQAIDRECASSPSTLPAAGNRYCIAPNGTGSKQCFYRPGDQPTYCAGSPAQKGAYMTTNSTGTFSIGKGMNPPAGTSWITDACFEGCAVTDPSSTTIATRVAYCVGNGHGGYTCY